MSYDIKLQNVCDHLINWERSTLEDDLKTILLRYPVASVAATILRIDSVIQDPSSYVVTKQPDFFVEIPPYKIEMLSKVKHHEPLIEVQYTVPLEFCPKCRSTRILDDLVYDTGGITVMAEKELLLIQRVEKVIITQVRSNVFHNWYGTDLHSLVGQKIKDMELLRTKIVEQISTAIDKLKAVQNQLLSSGRETTSGELFGELLSIELERSDDPTIVLVIVVFTAQSGQTLELSQFVELTNFRERSVTP